MATASPHDGNMTVIAVDARTSARSSMQWALVLVKFQSAPWHVFDLRAEANRRAWPSRCVTQVLWDEIYCRLQLRLDQRRWIVLARIAYAYDCSPLETSHSRGLSWPNPPIDGQRPNGRSQSWIQPVDATHWKLRQQEECCR